MFWFCVWSFGGGGLGLIWGEVGGFAFLCLQVFVCFLALRGPNLRRGKLMWLNNLELRKRC